MSEYLRVLTRARARIGSVQAERSARWRRRERASRHDGPSSGARSHRAAPVASPRLQFAALYDNLRATANGDRDPLAGLRRAPKPTAPRGRSSTAWRPTCAASASACVSPRWSSPPACRCCACARSRATPAASPVAPCPSTCAATPAPTMCAAGWRGVAQADLTLSTAARWRCRSTRRCSPAAATAC